MRLFSKKKDAMPEEITEEVQEKLNALAEKGNRLEQEMHEEEAVQVWKEALALIPQPQQLYQQTVWFMAAIGDVYFRQEKFKQAYACFDQARGNLSGEGYANPFVMLRLGECCLEIGDEKNALEYLLRAYMFEGEDIFDEDELKYFDFLKTHIDLHQEA